MTSVKLVVLVSQHSVAGKIVFLAVAAAAQLALVAIDYMTKWKV